ncbi:MAG: glucosamine-6-phosphate deaminase [Bacillota bacterium]|nr:glucosamine-6-phosphate deaminase [Bacillota bacterium]
MEIKVYKDYQAMSEAAAEMIKNEMKQDNHIVLGLATGSTPIGLYQKLAESCAAGEISFQHASSYNLDEYVGIPMDHPESYHTFMNENFFKHVDFPKGATHVPWTDGVNPEVDCRAYDEAVQKAGGIDIQVLGIGGNGHIAFNEPDESFTEETHIAYLDERTIQDNSRFFDSMEQVPKSAITVGMGVIMKARRVIILANGANKADAVYKMVHGQIKPQVPASILRLHPNVTLLLDEDAARKLKK